MHHADQRRRSGEDFITHPVGVAKICAGMRLDTETLCAALLHDTVEDTSASLEEVSEAFGEEIAGLVDGVTKLTGLTFQSRDEAQAENYRKMMVAMATDIRVILIKLADRLHNMRTIGAMPKQKQIEKSRETLDIYAPIAHRLGIHAIKWELEDLAFQTLHPRKYNEIKGLVAQQRGERERYVNEAGEYVAKELAELGIHAEISGRAKHFYSIYSKMTKKGREFNEIYDLTAMRVIVDSVKDTYGAVGVIHSLWKPLPGPLQGLHRDAEVQHVPVAAHDGDRARGPAAGDPDPDPRDARPGRVRDRRALDVQGGPPGAATAPRPDCATPTASSSGCARCWTGSRTWRDPREFMETLKVDLFEDEVFVFTPKGEVKSLAAGATPLDFAYEIHTDVGHRCVGAKVNGKIVPLSYQLRSGDIVEVLTSKRERGPSRDWLALVKTTRARNKIKAWFKAESRRDTEHTGRELLQEHLKKQGLPAQKLVGSPLLADVIREMGFRKADDFYIALGGAKISPKVVVNKVMQRLKQGEAAESEPTAADDLLQTNRRRTRPTTSSVALRDLGRGHRRGDAAAGQVLPAGARRPDRRLHLARPRDHHPPRGLPQRGRAQEGPRPLHPGVLGRRRRHLVPGRDRGRRLGPPPAARGHVADVRRGRDQHPRRALHGQPPDGQEPVRGRGGGHPHARPGDQPAAQHRRRVRRLPGHPRRRAERRPPTGSGQRPASGRLVAARARRSPAPGWCAPSASW